MPNEVLTKEPYKVLARKWRPRGFDDLAGQDTAVKILKNAISQRRIAHAYIFSGPRGVGKTSAARVFAKALNCERGPTPDPCDTCPNCVSIGNGSFLDVVEIDGASNNSVADIRELREKVKYAPSGAKYKIYIIDEAHMLSNAAFNALLKTLEEPPGHVVFILATTEPKRIITTVLSRCQHLPFKRIAIDIITQRLRVISEAAGFNITDEAVAALAKAADGSMRDSLTLLDQIASFATGSDGIDEADVSALIGISNVSAIASTAQAITSGNRKALIEIVADLYEGGIDLLSFMRDLIEYFRDALVAACKGAAEMGVSEEELTVVLGELLKAEGIIKGAQSPRAALEMCLIKISFLSSFKTINEIIRDLRADSPTPKPSPPKPVMPVINKPQGVKAEAKPLEQAAATPKAQGRQPNADTTDADAPPPIPEGGLWNKVIDRIYDASAPLWGILKDASVTIDETAVNIVLSGGNTIHADSVMEKKSIIEGVVNELSGKKYTILVKAAKPVKKPQKDLRAEALSNPVVKDALDLFGGAVVEVKPIVKK